MKVITLCGRCRDLFSQHYTVKDYPTKNAANQLKKKCDSCNKPYRAELRLYIVETKEG